MKILSALLGGAVATGTRTLTGQLIDLGNYAAGHSPLQYSGLVARACAVEGFPVGLLTAEKEVYWIKGDPRVDRNAKLVPYILKKNVTVTGEVTEENGTAMIAVSTIE